MYKGTHPSTTPVATKAAAFSKIFRWEPATPPTPPPPTVAVAGSFSEWRPLPLQKDRMGNGWLLALDTIPGNRTHRYMILVDGQPINDPNADGLALPETAAEKSFALTTARGPRVFMLFSQTK